MRTPKVLAVLVACLLVAPALADKGAFGGPGARILNRVEDLLDDEIVLDSIDGPALWESAPFNTSRFNRIGLRFSADTENGSVVCRVCWQFSAEDEYLDGIPSVTRGPVLVYQVEPGDPGEGEIVNPGDRPQWPDGLPDLYRQRYPYGLLSPSTDFTEVRGLRAKVRCYLGVELLPDYGFLGDDPSLNPGGPIESTAELTDVKILLRRE